MKKASPESPMVMTRTYFGPPLTPSPSEGMRPKLLRMVGSAAPFSCRYAASSWYLQGKQKREDPQFSTPSAPSNNDTQFVASGCLGFGFVWFGFMGFSFDASLEPQPRAQKRGRLAEAVPAHHALERRLHWTWFGLFWFVLFWLGLVVWVY
jgi:hypothetical protein